MFKGMEEPVIHEGIPGQVEKYEEVLGGVKKEALEELERRYPESFKMREGEIVGIIDDVLKKDKEMLSASLDYVDKTSGDETSEALDNRVKHVVGEVEDELRKRIQ